MNVKKAMTEQKLKYFSALTARQKDVSTFQVKKMKHNLINLPDGLVKEILFNINDRIDLSGCKMFKHENVYYPLNLKEFLTNNKTL